jgi:hypothetical protein
MMVVRTTPLRRFVVAGGGGRKMILIGELGSRGGRVNVIIVPCRGWIPVRTTIF